MSGGAPRPVAPPSEADQPQTRCELRHTGPVEPAGGAGVPRGRAKMDDPGDYRDFDPGEVIAMAELRIAVRQGIEAAIFQCLKMMSIPRSQRSSLREL
jgi:hypothetical protein